jgi:hypothetical protein
MDQRRVLLMTLAAAGLLSVVRGYETGAPDSSDICQSMMPNHNSTLPHTDTPKYQVNVSQTTYAAGESVDVTIVVLDYTWPMEGYLLEARLASNSSIVGHFTKIPINAAQICSGGGVTHMDKSKRNSTTFTWSPPAGAPPGDIYFVATVVRGFSRGFWTDLRSSTVTSVVTSTSSRASAAAVIFFLSTITCLELQFRL